jgi:hypothetical protein
MDTPQKSAEPQVRPIFAYIGLAVAFTFMSIAPIVIAISIHQGHSAIQEFLKGFLVVCAPLSIGLTIGPPCLKAVRFRLHLSTGIILMLAASAIVALNCNEKFPLIGNCYGFPATFSIDGLVKVEGPALLGLWTDFLLGTLSLYILGIFCEYIVMRRGTLVQRSDDGINPSVGKREI